MAIRVKNKGTVIDMDFRLQAMLGPAVNFQKLFEKGNAALGVAPSASLANLINDFGAFARDYFVFFAGQNMAQADTAKLRQELSSVLSNLQREWANISRACEQRQTPAFTENLADADKRAKDYYDRFSGFKPVDVHPVVFFEKAYAIRRHVFTQRPLISIPLQYLNDSQGWHALAHEMGHFIFWNGSKLDEYQQAHTTLRDALAAHFVHSVQTLSYENLRLIDELVNVWASWLEETFADIVGTLLAGPEFVLSAYKMLTETASTVDELTANDGEHPAPVIRVFIPLAVLRWAMTKLNIPNNPQDRSEGVNSLEDELKEFFERYKDEVLPETNLTMAEILATIPGVVTLILEGGTKVWRKHFDANSNPIQPVPADLGELFDLKLLETQLSNFEQRTTPIEQIYAQYQEIFDNLDFDRLPQEDDATTFGELMRFLRIELGANRSDLDEARREALLTMSLGETEGFLCNVVITRHYRRLPNGSLQFCF